ncbi:hypothetical protein EIP91_002967 [Steccherinum ochraceum]|uniref:Uncharacterized protein n=1 Tax=Steccherinum ochraceum TaxID=92696 RepID=A0A4R0RB54_9APHY|nr:hypothetical protein EIP91_002967 [Steccherinum ochraceum]
MSDVQTSPLGLFSVLALQRTAKMQPKINRADEATNSKQQLAATKQRTHSSVSTATSLTFLPSSGRLSREALREELGPEERRRAAPRPASSDISPCMRRPPSLERGCGALDLIFARRRDEADKWRAGFDPQHPDVVVGYRRAPPVIKVSNVDVFRRPVVGAGHV